MIKKESIELLIENADIVNIISQYVDLRKAGANYKARCPFHSEKTPSFVVSPTKNIFHCFGCGKGGNVLTFVQDIENLSFVEAVEELASRIGFQLEYEKNSNQFQNLSIFETVNLWFKNNLFNNRLALKYLYSRGITSSSIEKFKIGYALKSFDFMTFLQKKNIDFKDAEKLGLLVRDEKNRYYARFSERITFPIFSSSGKIIAFGGRTITNHPAKYLNSPTTDFFNKSKTVYGYNFAKNHILEQGRAYIVEGYLDVIMLHQAGINNAVAPLGTALTLEQLKIIAKKGVKIHFAFDGDSAGLKATIRALENAMPLGVETRVSLFPEGIDPADLVQNKQLEKLKTILNNNQDGVKFFIDYHLKQFDLNNPYQKNEVFQFLKTQLNKLPEVIRQTYFEYLAKTLNLQLQNYQKKPKNTSSANNNNNNIGECNGIGEMSILYSALQNPNFLNILKQELEENDFLKNRELLKLVLNNQTDEVELKLALCDYLYLIEDEKDFLKQILSIKKKRIKYQLENFQGGSEHDIIDLQYKLIKLNNRIHQEC